MKISQLIKLLEWVKDDHVDLTVVVNGTDGWGASCAGVSISEDDQRKPLMVYVGDHSLLDRLEKLPLETIRHRMKPADNPLDAAPEAEA